MFGIVTAQYYAPHGLIERAGARLRPPKVQAEPPTYVGAAAFVHVPLTLPEQAPRFVAARSYARAFAILRSHRIKRVICPLEALPGDFTRLHGRRAMQAAAFDSLMCLCRALGLEGHEVCALICVHRVSWAVEQLAFRLAPCVRSVRLSCAQSAKELARRLYDRYGILPGGGLPDGVSVIALVFDEGALLPGMADFALDLSCGAAGECDVPVYDVVPQAPALAMEKMPAGCDRSAYLSALLDFNGLSDFDVGAKINRRIP